MTGAAGRRGPSRVVELAKLDGLRVARQVSVPPTNLCSHRAGADVFVPRGDDFAQRILDAAPGGVDAVDTAVLDDAVLPRSVTTARSPRCGASSRPPTGGIDFRAVFVPTYACEQASSTGSASTWRTAAPDAGAPRALPAEKVPGGPPDRRVGGIRGRVVLEF
ncbi:hypothetical protein HBB16_01905 [Pseudonocardia sp. MCCB 268]|nr:hypothetical protein [Pseudonocardia cytotoxica]